MRHARPQTRQQEGACQSGGRLEKAAAAHVSAREECAVLMRKSLLESFKLGGSHGLWIP
jgi:hypothetical protein